MQWLNPSCLSRKAWMLLATSVLAFSLIGCSGGSGGASDSQASQPSAGTCETGNTAECGIALIAVTDADGDFVSYSVDVLSVSLQRANGASVETLPATTRVDFAQLTELSELLSVATLAPGNFVGGTIRLDYSNAEIFVESGGDVVPARVVDANGAPLGIAELEIRLAERNHLIVTRGRAAFLSLDFDLAASHSVDVAQTPALVTAQPYILAEVAPVDEKELRLRGALVDVDVASSSYVIDVRPWHRHDGNHGRITVHTTAATSFEIADATYTGDPGLRAMQTLPRGTLTVAFGTFDLQRREFTAEIVHAGESVSGERIDAVHGSIVARSGTRLTVKGAFAVGRDGGARRFHRTVLVDVGPDTKVLKLGAPGQVLDAGALSVGQHIVAFGNLSVPSPSTIPVLDATNARIRMLVTRLHGTALVAMPGQLNMQLRAVGHLPIEMFDFSGTGVTPALDADPANYEIAIGTLSLNSVEIGKPASVLGFVEPFGAAPPDFAGRTVIDHRELVATLGIGWGTEGTTAPFSTIGPRGFAFDLSNPSIGDRHHLVLGRRVVDLFDLPASPTVEPSATGRTMFGLVNRGRVELFAEFDAFAAKLTSELAAGTRARALTAHGNYDDPSNTLAANRIVVHLDPAN
jgi:hypothetical protein